MGNLLIVLIALITAGLAVPAASWAGGATWLSLTASSVAFVLMGVNIVLASRLFLVEKIFGGLDRVYFAHKWSGISILGLLIVHYLVTPNFTGLTFSTSLNNLAVLLGQIAMFSLWFLLAISAIKRLPKLSIEIPYNIWRWTHKFVGAMFVLVALHQAFVKRPYNGAEMFSSWLNIWALIGIVFYFYTLLVPRFRRKKYRVSHVERHDFATLVTLEPLNRPARVLPGQFAFISFNAPKLKEPHPFTVCGNKEGNLQFAIRPSGDFTKFLGNNLALGTDAFVSGGHGGFVSRRGGTKQIWLAGGIGITPFLAFLRGNTAFWADKTIHLIHCVGSEEQSFSHGELEAISSQNENFSYSLHCSKTDGRLSADLVKGHLPFDANSSELWFCGPPMLRQVIVAGLSGQGISLKKVEFERFEFR